MFKKIAIATGLALGLIACSTTATPSPFEIFLGNLTAGICDNPQAALAQVPLGMISQAQALLAVQGVCTGMFGTAAAPAPAPGNQPAIK